MFASTHRTPAQDLPYGSRSTGGDGPLRYGTIVDGGRTDVAGAYDPLRNEFIIFGGRSSIGDSAETWRCDNTGAWTRLNPVRSPGARHSHQIVWCANAASQGLFLFGGIAPNGTRLRDVWLWNGTTWDELIPRNRTPSGRDSFAMAYHPAKDKVILFGGNGGANETWLWDGRDWAGAGSTVIPPATVGNAMAYSPLKGSIVMFTENGETWLWNDEWSRLNPSRSPPARRNARMAWDEEKLKVILFGGDGRGDAWQWTGDEWLEFEGVPTSQRSNFAMDYHPKLHAMMIFGGSTPADPYSSDTLQADMLRPWRLLSGKELPFDMSARPDGIWNFTTIDVPAGVTVRFKKNAVNTPVRWLATQNVTIKGTIDASGQSGSDTLPLGVAAAGGPGGFDGGLGALPKAQSGTNVGGPGQGPGGGLPGPYTDPMTNATDPSGRNGEYAASYGNVYLQPLVGGSGGGGGSSSDTTPGGNGGGGGGAILIDSSRDIMLDGVIRANGGNLGSYASYGGRGSGGSILLRADRISGTGKLEAFTGGTGAGTGRIRLEAFYRLMTPQQSTPIAVTSVPSASRDLNTGGELTVARISGVLVSNSPTGNPLVPDVVFQQAGTITVDVSARGVPVGTPIRLRIATATGVITPAPVNLNSVGIATFTGIVVPAGVGTIQASAEFTTPN
jgi:hypothetical protein